MQYHYFCNCDSTGYIGLHCTDANAITPLDQSLAAESESKTTIIGLSPPAAVGVFAAVTIVPGVVVIGLLAQRRNSQPPLKPAYARPRSRNSGLRSRGMSQDSSGYLSPVQAAAGISSSELSLSCPASTSCTMSYQGSSYGGSFGGSSSYRY